MSKWGGTKVSKFVLVYYLMVLSKLGLWLLIELNGDNSKLLILLGIMLVNWILLGLWVKVLIG